jgi:hypothetical protein
LFANIKKAYFLVVSAFFAALSALWAEESAFIAEESAFIAEESAFTAEESPDLASVLELLLQAAKAPIASTIKNFFMFEFLMLIEWFPINTCPIKK